MSNAFVLLLALAVEPAATLPTAIVDVRVEVGDGTVLESATVVIDGGRIHTVGTATPPAGAEVIDGRGKVLSPGFIESVSQIGLTEVALESSTNDYAAPAPAAPAFRAADAFNPSSVRIPINREEGITRAITAPSGALLHGAGYWIDLTGSVESMPDPARPVAMFGAIQAPGDDASIPSRAAQWLRLREIFADARFYGAHRGEFERGSAPPLTLAPIHLEALQPVLRGELPLCLYVDRAADILAALAFASEQKVRLVISGGAEAWRVGEQLRRAQVPVLFKPTAQVPMSFTSLAARDDAATLLREAGVQLVITSADWDSNIRRLRQEAGIAVSYGLPHAEAMRAISLAPAMVFGRAAELGSVTAGKRADLVLWSGDPLELDSVVERLWIDGRPMSLDNRQRRLVQRYLPAARETSPAPGAQQERK